MGKNYKSLLISIKRTVLILFLLLNIIIVIQQNPLLKGYQHYRLTEPNNKNFIIKDHKNEKFSIPNFSFLSIDVTFNLHLLVILIFLTKM
jgi:hypothetical protein